MGYFLYAQGDAIGLMTFDENVREFLPPRHRTGHLRHLMLALERAAGGKTTALLKGLGNYKSLTFDKKGGQLAFVSDRDDYKADKPGFKLYHWAPPAAAAAELVSGATKGFPAGLAVSENGTLSFSEDGARLFFGIAPVPKPEPKDAPEPIKETLNSGGREWERQARLAGRGRVE